MSLYSKSYISYSSFSAPIRLVFNTDTTVSRADGYSYINDADESFLWTTSKPVLTTPQPDGTVSATHEIVNWTLYQVFDKSGAGYFYLDENDNRVNVSAADVAQLYRTCRDEDTTMREALRSFAQRVRV